MEGQDWPGAWKGLGTRYEVVVRDWQERRKELQDLALAVVERIKVEENYAKGIEKVGRTVQKNIKENGVASFAFSAFLSDHLNRAEQSKHLAESLKDEVQQLIRKVLDKQAAAYKKLSVDIKSQEKDLVNKKEQIDRLRSKAVLATKECETAFIGHESARLSNITSSDKKQKAALKFSAASKQTRQLRDQLKDCVRDFNAGLSNYQRQLERGLGVLQQQQFQRTSLQLDVVMKFLVFETSMIKNHEYDIDNIGKQLETVKPQTELQTLAQDYRNQPQAHRMTPESITTTFFQQTMRRVESTQFFKVLEEEANKANRELLQAGLQGHNVQFENPQIQRLVELVISLLGEGKEADPEVVRQIFQSGVRLQFYWLLKLRLQQLGKYQLSEGQYEAVSRLIKQLINLCATECEAFLIRRLLQLSVIYFKVVEVKRGEEEGLRLEFYLIYSLIELQVWRVRSFWQATIVEMVEEQGRNIIKSVPGEVLAESIERERTTKLGQLAAVCNFMLMLLIHSRQVRILVGNFCLAFLLTDDQNRSLSATIKQIFKQVMQAVEAGLLPSFGHNSIPGLKEEVERLEAFTRF